MDRRTSTEAAARNVVSVAAAAGVPIHTLAEATDIDPSAMDDLVHARRPFTIAELGRVGGFFRVPIGSLLEGAAA